MIVDGVNLETAGLIVGDRGESRSSPRFRDPYEGVPAAWQTIRLGRGTTEPKLITLDGAITAGSLSELRDRIDEIMWRLRPQAEHTLRWSDDATREWVVHFEQVRILGVGAEWLQPHVRVSISVRAEDPRARAVAETTDSNPGSLSRFVTVSTIGNAPMPVVITITGSSDPLTLTRVEYQASGGAVVSKFDYTGPTLNTLDTLVIDTRRQVVERNGVNDIDNIDDPDGGLGFEVDPDDGDFLTQSNPRVRLVGLNTANQFDVTYRERWWS